MTCSKKELREATVMKHKILFQSKVTLYNIYSRKTMKMYKPVYFMTISKY